MKKDWLTLLCMTLVCATVMFGIMGIYKLIGQGKFQKDVHRQEHTSTAAFKTRSTINLL